MSDFDSYLLDSDGSNFRFQVHHLIMPSLLKDPIVEAILNSLGFDAAALEAKGNKLGVMFNVDFALQLQEQVNPAIAEAFKQAGFGFNVQYTNHPELTNFVADRILEIGNNSNLSTEAKQKAIYAITEFSRDLAYADVKHNGNVVPLIKPQGLTSDQFSAEIEAAFDTYRIDKGWPKFDQASSNGNNGTNPFQNDAFVAQYDISQIDVGTNNNIEFRLELTRDLIATSFESGLINQIQFDQSMQKLAKAEGYAPGSSSRASHTSGAAISFMYDLSRGFQDPASSNNERTKDMLAETIASTLHLQNDSKSIAEYKAVVLRQMDQLVENAANVERGINAIQTQPDIKVGHALRTQITGAVGGVGIGDAFEFLNNAYDSIKYGAKTGDWAPLGALTLTSGIAAVGWALIAGGSTAIATGINPLLGYYVAAGWGAYGIWDGADNAYKLFNKIADDINYLLGLVTFVGPSTYIDQALLEYMQDRLDAPVIDALLVDNMNPQKPGIVFGSDASELIFGRNDAEIHGGGGDDEIQYRDFTGDAQLFGDDGNDLLLLREARYAHVDGGNGNDIIYLDKRGVGGEFFGGAGRDWLFVQAQGADLYGDTVDGLDSEGVKLENGAANADQFWFWPNTTIKDASRSDILEFYGMPLTGGSEGLPLIVTGVAGFLGFAASEGAAVHARAGQEVNHPLEGRLFFDSFAVFINYIFQKEKDGSLSLYIANSFNGLAGMFGDFDFSQTGNGTNLRGLAKVENYQATASYWGSNLFSQTGLISLPPGTLGMKFLAANPFFAAIALLPPIAGLDGKLFAYIDRVIALADAGQRYHKALKWLPLGLDGGGDDPLILDLDGVGIETFSLGNAGVWFDHDQNLFAEQTGWLKGDDGFLILDENGNGIVDDGREMFGGRGQTGLQELALHDLNQDGKINRLDSVYGELRIWRDLNEDGQTDAGELFTLEAIGILEINTAATPLNSRTPQGTWLISNGTFVWQSGGVGNLFDAVFRTSLTSTQFLGQTGTAPWLEGVGVDARSYGAIVDLSVAMSNDLEFGALVKASAASMTVPKLKLLREQSAEVLGQWGQVLEQTRELTAVRMAEVDGITVLADYGVYNEDATGGFFTLHSGAAIVDAQGNAVARATLEDVLAQSGFTLTQTFSPSSRGEATQFRAEVPYLTQIVNERVVILDHGVRQADGSWALASGQAIVDAQGQVIAAPTLANILAQAHVAGTAWTTEEIGFNPYADIPVEKIGIYFLDGKAIDYTVEVTDERGTFYVWARNIQAVNDNLRLQFAAQKTFIFCS